MVHLFLWKWDVLRTRVEFQSIALMESFFMPLVYTIFPLTNYLVEIEDDTGGYILQDTYQGTRNQSCLDAFVYSTDTYKWVLKKECFIFLSNSNMLKVVHQF